MTEASSSRAALAFIIALAVTRRLIPAILWAIAGGLAAAAFALGFLR